MSPPYCKRKYQCNVLLSEREIAMLRQMADAEETPISQVIRTLIRQEFLRRHPLRIARAKP